MSKNAISLAYLQSLSTADLLLLADDYGIDIPEQLNRSFVISELYEIANESFDEDFDSEIENTDVQVKTSSSLPETYNETQIDVVLRTPVWAYVFWDISNASIQENINSKSFSKILLKVNFWNETSEKAIDSFDLSVSEKDREQYILIPRNQKEFSIDLVVEFTNKTQNKLASSRRVKIPQGTPEITLESLDSPISPIMELSGYKDLIKQQYDSHRQSFS